MSLPSGYRQLEYIETDGNSYIDTGYKPDRNTVLEGRFLLGTEGTLFGASNSSSASTGWFMCGKVGGYYRFRVVTSDYINLTAPFNTVSDFYFCGREKAMITQGENVYQTSVSRSNTTVSSYNLYILGRNEAGTVKDCRAGNRVYYIKLYTRVSEGNYTLLYDFIPAQRKSDGAVGLYDLLNDNFHANIGTGKFIHPYEISANTYPANAGTISGQGQYVEDTEITLTANPNPGYGFVDWELSEYRMLDYLESDGNQWIDTGIVPQPDLTIKISFEFTNTSGTQCLLGVAIQQMQECNLRVSSSKFGARWNHGTANNNIATADTSRHTFEINNDGIFFDGVLATSIGTTYNPNTIYLFKEHQTNSSYADEKAKAKVYSLEITRVVDGVTRKHTYKPAKRTSDDAVGMLEECNYYSNGNLIHWIKFRENLGTGSLSYGEEYITTKTYSENPIKLITNDHLSFLAFFEKVSNCRFKVNGAWKEGTMYVKKNGQWEIGQPKVKVNGVWKNSA